MYDLDKKCTGMQDRMTRSSINLGVLCIFLNKIAAWRYLITHKHGENAVGFGAILNGYLPQYAPLRTHCCIPQLLCIQDRKSVV